MNAAFNACAVPYEMYEDIWMHNDYYFSVNGVLPMWFFGQSNLHDTSTTFTPSYVYDDRCESFEIKFGDLESNETKHESTSSNQCSHQGYIPIDK